MANFIQNLQRKNELAKNTVRETRTEIQEFRKFLLSSKFVGEESDGSRRDWIATGDVDRFLASLDSMLRIDLATGGHS